MLAGDRDNVRQILILLEYLEADFQVGTVGRNFEEYVRSIRNRLNLLVSPKRPLIEGMTCGWCHRRFSTGGFAHIKKCRWQALAEERKFIAEASAIARQRLQTIVKEMTT